MDKKNAFKDFQEVVEQSWSYAKLTQKEKHLLWNNIETYLDEGVSGTYKQRRNTLNAMYGMFLAGLGYDHQPNWRDDEGELPF